MSHLGNWEAAAYISNLKGYRMMIYMGRRDRKYLEQQQKRELSEAGVRLQAVGEDDGSPANAIEGFNHVRGGGFVAMSADRLWTPGQRRMQAAFHGRIIQLPAAPYALALAARVPLCAFFCVREKDGTFRLIVRPPVSISAARREEREQALASGARYYLNELDRMLPDYLHQWANFEPFFGPPAG
jgi:predicted LPLAT superfamily acyltransferase